MIDDYNAWARTLTSGQATTLQRLWGPTPHTSRTWEGLLEKYQEQHRLVLEYNDRTGRMHPNTGVVQNAAMLLSDWRPGSIGELPAGPGGGAGGDGRGRLVLGALALGAALLLGRK